MMSNDLSKKPGGAPENEGATKDQEAGAVVLEAPNDPGPMKDREEDWITCYTRKFGAKATTDPTEAPSVAETNRTGAPKKE